MTLASVIEGVANLMFPAVKHVRVAAEEADEWETSIRSLEAYVMEWKGEIALRRKLMTSLQYARKKGVLQQVA